MNDTTAMPAAGDAQAVAQLSMWEKIHADTVHGWEIFSRLFPVMEKIAVHPDLRELFTEAMRALADGVAAERFQAATDLLRGARYRVQQAAQDGVPPAPGTGPQPSFQATGTGPQADAATLPPLPM